MSVDMPTVNVCHCQNFTKLILTLSKSAKSESSPQRFLITFWYSARRVGQQSPLPSITVALNAVEKIPLKCTFLPFLIIFHTHAIEILLIEESIVIDVYFASHVKSMKGNKKRDNDLI